MWETMVQEVRKKSSDAVEKSGKPLAVDPFFMILLLAQQGIIKLLLEQLRAPGVYGQGCPQQKLD